MSFAEQSSQLARGLARLAASGGSLDLDREGLEEALAARQEVLQLLRTVLYDLRVATVYAVQASEESRPSGLPRPPRSAAAIEADPVAALEATLAAYPAPAGLGVGRGGVGVAGESGAGPTADGWAAVGRHAVLARAAWSEIEPIRVPPLQQWSAVADVAALAQAVAVVDQDLAEAARRMAAPAWRPLAAATRAGLRTTAESAAALAAGGPLPEWGREAGSLLLVRSPADLPAAQQRLVEQLDAAAGLSPRSVVLVATGQVRLLAAGAAVLGSEPAHAGRVAEARELQERVSRAVASGHLLAARGQQDDRRPVAQCREMVGVLEARRALSARLPRMERLGAFGAMLDRVPAVLAAVSRQAEHGVRSGQWLVPDVGHRSIATRRWVPVARGGGTPPLCAELAAAAARAAAGRPAPLPPLAPPPREVLAGISAAYRPRRPVQPFVQRRTGPAGRG